MTRIRSTREVRITPPVTACNGSGAARADRPTVSADSRPDDAQQRFGALYDAARQRAGNGAQEDASDQDSPQRDAQHDGASTDTHVVREATDADAAPLTTLSPLTMPLPSVPPLPPLHPLSNALYALRRNRRAVAANTDSAAGRKSTSTSAEKNTFDEPHASGEKIADELFGIQMIRRCAQAAEGDLLAQHLAEHVAGFCTSPAVKGTGQWQIAVELDPSILPRTQLHLSLSGPALSLRFDSRDPRGRQLICDNSNELKSRIEARLGGQIAVEVTVL